MKLFDAYPSANKFLRQDETKMILNNAFNPCFVEDKLFVYKKEDKHDNNIHATWLLASCEHSKEYEIINDSESKLLTCGVNPHTWKLTNNTISFVVGNRKLSRNIGLQKGPLKTENIYSNMLQSPDGEYAAYCAANNLFIIQKATNHTFQITKDGKENCAYAVRSGGSTRFISDKVSDADLPPIAFWSPNSRYLVTIKLDERQVRQFHLLGYAAKHQIYERPQIFSYRYPLPFDDDDKQAWMQIYIYDTYRREIYKCQSEAIIFSEFMYFTSLPDYRFISWSYDNTSFFVRTFDRDYKRSVLSIVNAEDGAVKIIDCEESDTFIFSSWHSVMNSPECEPLSSPKAKYITQSDKKGRVYFLSERNGWNHLYVVEADSPARQITSGEWVVRQILYIDSEEEIVYISASGVNKDVNPYYMQIYSVGINTGEHRLLTPENANHYAVFSPDGEYFTDYYSTPNTEPIVLLREKGGSVIREIIRSDAKEYFDAGYVPTIPVTVRSTNDKYDLFGLFVPPSKILPGVKYPLVEYIYGGPQTTATPTNFLGNKDIGYLQAFSNINFASVVIDARGTPYRGKVFHDYAWRNLGDSSCLDDHRNAIEQVCSQFDYIDKDRVGVWGHSAGGNAAVRLLSLHGDVYKVAVASAGCYDLELYLAGWSECFMNRYDEKLWKEQDTKKIICQISGKLLLMHGDMDDNVHPAMTMELASELIKHNIDFDMMIIPGANHEISRHPFFQNKLMEYFMQNL